MANPIPYASARNAPPAAWCPRCGTSFETVPERAICSSCQGALSVSFAEAQELVRPVGAVLRMSEVAIIGAACFAMTATSSVGLYAAGFVLGLAWVVLLRFLAVILHVLAVSSASPIASRGGRRSRLLWWLMVIGLPASAIGFAGDVVPWLRVHIDSEAWMKVGFVGVAFAQFAIFRMVADAGYLSKAADFRGPLGLGQILAVMVVGWVIAAAWLQLAHGLTMSVIVAVMVVQILLLYRTRAGLKGLARRVRA